MISSDQVYIRRVRVTGPVIDHLPARQQLSAAIDPNLLRLIGLSPESILCIRSLRDPRPGAFHFHSSTLNSNLEWKSAFLESMRRLAQTAVHPTQGSVPANAQAVIFSERSELLACLAADWCAGEVAMHWWWKSLLRSGDVDRAVIDAWLESPHEIPAALQQLRAIQRSIPFIRKLDDQSLNQIFEKLLATYGLFELQRSIGRQQMEPSTSVPRTEFRAPWHFHIQDTAIEPLPAHRQLALGVGLMLYRNPSLVRTRLFAIRVMEWQAAIGGFESEDGSIVAESSAPEVAQAVMESSHHTRSGIQGAPVDESATDIDTRHNTSAPDEDGTIPEHMASTAKLMRMSDIQTSLASAHVDENTQSITSQFGGTCYFINLGLFLNLYGDFTTPLQPGIDLPIWDFMALVAQQILGDEVTRDPIWALLAALAGRNEHEAPGTGFRPSEHESMEAWLADLMLRVKPRLRSALGITHDNVAQFFTQPARVVVTSSRFDAYFEMGTLPIEIRLSGLDRDPGWVPAAGKYIGFHYE
jgi:hypothetical protein